ncbi:uncharacterized protein PITG_06191 [Phytophthora infestans T30-4]|uniref:Peptidase S1 domain-containing protein n=2 Tax=Phytophthora infestans TaxID=4787 RepID=D0N4A7_PHYIT|nr:uncharacterized protein PITG_06191 [Phytophthora infestans T30-4]EEY69715.1 conserved hypothetical protein [Phytophthora infestans T30-4]|eukprot:XP_002998362.1 conserved hypothetical protein [Phytophthora infestans T30-4]
MNHPNFSSNIDFSSDFTLLELDTPSSYKPVKLAGADDSDFKAGAAATAIGWGLTGENGAMSNELLSVDLTVLSDKECEQLVTIDSSMLCVKGVISKGACAGDTGGPLVVESTSNGRDILVGVVSWNKDKGCGQGPFYPGMYSRVSRARSWIDPIIGSSCFD